MEFHNYSEIEPNILNNLGNITKLKLNKIDEENSKKFSEELEIIRTKRDSEKIIENENKVASLELIGGNTTLKSISILFHNLNYLNLTLEFGTTDEILTKESFAEAKLDNLSEFELFFLPVGDIEAINEFALPVFKNCPLKKLTIDKADSKTCNFITTNWNKLEHLKIDCGMDIEDGDIRSFTELSELKSFTLSYAQNITDDSISSLVRKCNNLNQLSLFYMLKITETTLDLIIKKARSYPESEFFCDFYDTAVEDREYSPPENLFIDIYNQREHSDGFDEYMAQFDDYDDYYDEIDDDDDFDDVDDEEDFDEDYP